MTFNLQAVCKGDTLKLDHPIELPQDTPVRVMVFTDDEREEWLRFSSKGLEAAYGDDQPDYTLDEVIK